MSLQRVFVVLLTASALAVSTIQGDESSTFATETGDRGSASTANVDTVHTTTDLVTTTATETVTDLSSTATRLSSTTDVTMSTEDGTTTTTTTTEMITSTTTNLDTTTVDLDTTTKDLDTTTAGFDTTTAGLDTTTTGLDTTTADLDTTTEDLATTTAGLDTTTAGLDTTTAGFDTTTTNIDTTTADLDTTTVVLGTTSVDLDTTTAGLDTATAEFDTTTANLGTTTAEFNTTAVNLDTTTADFDTTTADLDTTTVDFDTTTADLGTTTSGLDTTTAGLDTTTADLDTTTTGLDTTTADLDTTTAEFDTTTANLGTTTAEFATTTANLDTTTADFDTTTADLDTTTADPDTTTAAQTTTTDVIPTTNYTTAEISTTEDATTTVVVVTTTTEPETNDPTDIGDIRNYVIIALSLALGILIIGIISWCVWSKVNRTDRVYPSEEIPSMKKNLRSTSTQTDLYFPKGTYIQPLPPIDTHLGLSEKPTKDKYSTSNSKPIFANKVEHVCKKTAAEDDIGIISDKNCYMYSEENEKEKYIYTPKRGDVESNLVISSAPEKEKCVNITNNDLEPVSSLNETEIEETFSSESESVEIPYENVYGMQQRENDSNFTGTDNSQSDLSTETSENSVISMSEEDLNVTISDTDSGQSVNDNIANDSIVTNTGHSNQVDTAAFKSNDISSSKITGLDNKKQTLQKRHCVDTCNGRQMIESVNDSSQTSKDLFSEKEEMSVTDSETISGEMEDGEMVENTLSIPTTRATDIKQGDSEYMKSGSFDGRRDECPGFENEQTKQCVVGEKGVNEIIIPELENHFPPKRHVTFKDKPDKDRNQREERGNSLTSFEQGFRGLKKTERNPAERTGQEARLPIKRKRSAKAQPVIVGNTYSLASPLHVQKRYGTQYNIITNPFFKPKRIDDKVWKKIKKRHKMRERKQTTYSAKKTDYVKPDETEPTSTIDI